MPGRVNDLQALAMGLDNCQKSLNDYLDTKRNAFPRFFFISDDELLSILGNSDPQCVQEHIVKVKCSMFMVSTYFYTDYFHCKTSSYLWGYGIYFKL